MRIVVDQGACIGAGHCVETAASVFDQNDDDGIVILLDEFPDASLRTQVKDAAQLCPAQAIKIVDE